MSMLYSWIITSLNKDNDNVVGIHWRFEGTDGINAEGVSGYTPAKFEESNLTDLSVSGIEEWIVNNIGNDKIDEYKSEIEKRLKDYAIQTTTVLPWSAQNVEPQ